MREIPVLFRDDLVREILAGRKTVTRRVGKTWARARPGDRLWVRECHALLWKHGDGPPSVDAGLIPEDYDVEYRADGRRDRLPGHWPETRRGDPDCPRWRPSIFMPRWACRLELDVVSVEAIERPERVDHCENGHESEPQAEDRCPKCGDSLISTWGEPQADRYRTRERYDHESAAGRADVEGDLWLPDIAEWLRVNDREARREGFPDALAFAVAWNTMNPQPHPWPVYRVEFQRVPRG